MKKLLLILLCLPMLFSCGEFDKKNEISSKNDERIKKRENTYQVLKIIKDKSAFNDSYKFIGKIEDIAAKEDSLAYAKGFKSFCINVRVNEMMREKVGNLYSEIKSFKLLKNNIDITNDIEFSNKKDVHDKIINYVFQSVPELLNKTKTTLKIESINRNRVFFNEENVKQFKTLYKELLVFKDSPDFHSIGFSTDGIYYQWLKATKELSSISGLLFIEYGFVTGDLTMLGLSYLDSKGDETEYTTELNKSIKSF
tara:strand:+ start:170 stop:931 length:762 start_codon:yes stop_codon:yes gene_type:complete